MSAVRLPVASALAASPHRNRTFQLPDLVSDLLDRRVEELRAMGFRCTRADIVGALVQGVAASGNDGLVELGEQVQRYLAMKVGEAASVSAGNFVELRPTVPGRRPLQTRTT